MRSWRLLLVAVASTALSTSVVAQELVINAAVPVDKERIAPGTYGRIRLHNVMPGREYAVEASVEAHPIPAIDIAAAQKKAKDDLDQLARTRARGTAECERLGQVTDELLKAQTEGSVPQAVQKVEIALGAVDPAACPSVAIAAQAALARTIWIFTTYLPIELGSFATIVAYRIEPDRTPVKVAEKVFDTGVRGSVRTHLLLGALPNSDERWFAKAAGEGKFVVTEEEDRRLFDPLAAVLFTWQPIHDTSGPGQVFAFKRGDVSGSLTVGVGVEATSPVYLAGYTLNLTDTFGLAAGVAAFHRDRLKGIYKGDGTDELTENLQQDQLVEATLGFGGWVGITFRR